jgi:hypothetical protein
MAEAVMTEVVLAGVAMAEAFMTGVVMLKAVIAGVVKTEDGHMAKAVMTEVVNWK